MITNQTAVCSVAQAENRLNILRWWRLSLTCLSLMVLNRDPSLKSGRIQSTSSMMKQLVHYMVIMLVGRRSSRYMEWPPLQKSFSDRWKSSEPASLGRASAVVADVWGSLKINHTVCLQSPRRPPAEQQRAIWWSLMVMVSRILFATKKKVKLNCLTENKPILM